jgi:methyl-accepting chemotaxis protein
MFGKKVTDLRTQILIEPNLQKKIMGNFFLLGCAMVFVNVLGLYFLVGRIIQYVENMSQVSPELYEVMIKAFSDLALGSFVLSLIVIMLFCLYSLYYSNRIAGPIYQLNKSIGRILEGEKNVEIKFRKDDYFQELSERMNLLIKKYYEKE